MATKKIFISCGQRTDDEKQLGNQIQSLVKELTAFEPYFAEFQNTLEGLTKNIFSELFNCVGFITVMHRRGIIETNTIQRASVWVEQEIAIAAFIREVLAKKIKIIALSETGILLEGIRAQLLLNPYEFTSNSEAINYIRGEIIKWSSMYVEAENLSLSLRYEKKSITQERHEYDFIVEIENKSNVKIDDYHVDLEFPNAILPNHNFVHEVKERSTNSHIFLRAPPKGQVATMYPGDTKIILRVNYYVDKVIFDNKSLLELPIKAVLYDKENLLQIKTMQFSEIQNY